MIEVSGVGYTPEGGFTGRGEVRIGENRSLRLLLQGGVLCNDAELYQGEEKWDIKDNGDRSGCVSLIASDYDPTK